MGERVSVQVDEVFRNPREVTAWLKAGKTIALTQGGRAFAYVIPESQPPSAEKPSRKTAPRRKSAYRRTPLD